MAFMQIISVNVGRPREVQWRERIVQTSIFKEPVEGRVRVRRLNIDGDQQSDLTVHGGAEKAVYLYPSEHYAFWRNELPDAVLPWGAFGENLTSAGLTENDVRIGDRFAIGSAEFLVTQPRMPCFKLTIRFGRADMIKRFLRSGRSGFYLAVTKEGEIAAGDEISVISRQPGAMTIAEAVRGRAQWRSGFERFWISLPAVSIAVPVACAASRAPAATSLPASFTSRFASAVAAVSTVGTVAETVVVRVDVVAVLSADVVDSVFWVQAAKPIRRTAARIVVFMLSSAGNAARNQPCGLCCTRSAWCRDSR